MDDATLCYRKTWTRSSFFFFHITLCCYGKPPCNASLHCITHVPIGIDEKRCFFPHTVSLCRCGFRPCTVWCHMSVVLPVATNAVRGRESECLTLCFSVFQPCGSIWIWFSAAQEGAEALPVLRCTGRQVSELLLQPDASTVRTHTDKLQHTNQEKGHRIINHPPTHFLSPTFLPQRGKLCGEEDIWQTTEEVQSCIVGKKEPTRTQTPDLRESRHHSNSSSSEWKSFMHRKYQKWTLLFVWQFYMYSVYVNLTRG